MASISAAKNPPPPLPPSTKAMAERESLTSDDLKTLGHQLLSSRAHINNLPILLSFITPSSPLDLALESLISLQSFFTPLLPDIPSSSSSSSAAKSGVVKEDPEKIYWAWLRVKFDEFVNSLIAIAVSPHCGEDLRDVALDALMDFVQMGKGGRFQSAIYHKFLHCIVRATTSVDQLLDLLTIKYFKYIDVRYFTYTSIDKIAKTCESSTGADSRKVSLSDKEVLSESSNLGAKSEIDIHILYNILSRVPPLESEDKELSDEMFCQTGLFSKEAETVCSKDLDAGAKPKKSKKNVSSTGHVSKKFKLKFTKAWLSFLKLPLPLDVYKEVLVTLHRNVMPYMANPAILCDFLTRSYDIGGVISVMALSGLFTLMTQYGLEYPNFYEKLYALLTPAVFMAKHRAVFFELLDSCLKSSYLPAYLAAAFAKRLSRLALLVPPPGALVIIALTHNLLRRHPSINFLVHQQINGEIDGDASMEENELDKDAQELNANPVMHINKQSVDPFNNEETDPAKSGAMLSSLWEVDTLRHHYCPAVSRNVDSLENDLTVRAKTSEVKVSDFSSGSYATIFRDEVRRRIKQVPLAFYKVTPTSLFLESDFPGWAFGGDLQNDKHIGIEENDVVNTVVSEDHNNVKRQRIECP